MMEQVISERSTARGRFSPGIQAKILICFLVVILAFAGLALAAFGSSATISREYGDSIDRFLMVHRFRLGFNSLHRMLEHYIRDPPSVNVEIIYRSIGSLHASYRDLRPLEDYSIHAGFETRAIGYALEVYLPLVSKAVNLRAAGSNEYFQPFLDATRIQGYIATYLDRLLTELLKQSEETHGRLVRSIRRTRTTIFLAAALASLLAIAAILFVTTSITGPLHHLAEVSNELARGNLDVSIRKVRSRDEVAALTSNFTLMAANLRTLVEGLKEKAELERLLHEEELALAKMGEALREAQYLNLQEQLKPHFLFNALNTIARMALVEQARETEQLVMKLAHLLRATLDERGNMSTLGEELSLAESYLAFQQARFGARLRWDIRIAPTVRNAMIPRLLLQPLVENAVRHGIEPKEEGGTILLKAVRRGCRLTLWVVDDGVGMGRERLEAIKAHLAAPAARSADDLVEGRGIGLANVALRLHLLYGTDAAINIRSMQGRGTMVRIVLPGGE
ncbi:MAG: histidine kinase [Rectinemataceae bacterium]